MKKTQRKIVLEKLKADGEVTNVWAMQNHIFRLSERIREPKEEGYGIEAEYAEGKTYQYTLTQKPMRIEYQPVLKEGVMMMRPVLV